MTLPTRAPVLALGLSMIVRPNGHNAYDGMSRAAKLKEVVTIKQEADNCRNVDSRESAKGRRKLAIWRSTSVAYLLQVIIPPYRVTTDLGASLATVRVESRNQHRVSPA